MFKKVLAAAACIACILSLQNSAFAVTVNGDEYTEFLTLDAEGKAGYWVSKKKFYTGGNNPVDVDVEHIDGALAAYEDEIDEFYFMGRSNTAQFDSTIQSGVLQLFGDDDELLLSATYASNGVIDSTRRHGLAGQLDIMGLYTVTGGLFSDLGLVTGSIYAQFLYDRVTAKGKNDLHVTDGTIRLYRQDGGETEIPEPATAALLASGLLGAGRIRRRNKQKPENTRG